MRSVAVVLLSFTGWLLCLSQPHLPADTLNPGENITVNSTLVSISETYELGFFSPAESTRRYLGIWYYNKEPQTVVWVANRDNHVQDSTASFHIAEDGNLKVSSDTSGKSYWSSGLRESSSSNRTVNLNDSGNLVLQDTHTGKILWQSFDHPTDTFLPFMKMDRNIKLISWRNISDPAPGNFTFQLDPTGDGYIISKNPDRPYWKAGNLNSEALPSTISYLLTNFSLKPAVSCPEKAKYTSCLRDSTRAGTVYNFTRPVTDYNFTRLVMNYTGKIQFYKYEDNNLGSGWSTPWGEPSEECKIYNACGNFSSCNNNNLPKCKCLPGFEPLSRGNGNGSCGELFEGCVRKSASCERKDITFLKLGKVKVGNSGADVEADSEADCQTQCLNNCSTCQAYSYSATRSDRGFACLIWTQELLTLQEYSLQDGIDLSVRVQISDIEPTAKTCIPCGTTMIPYPLSTGPDCGDPMYLKLNCDNSTGDLSFMMPRHNLSVISINSDAQNLIIQTDDTNLCDDKDQRDQLDPPFNVTSWCYGKDGIEVSWLPPLEPLCNDTTDCNNWPHSSCNVTSDGKRRCLCDANYHWHELNCAEDRSILGSKEPPSERKNPLTLILAVALPSMAFMACLIAFAYAWRRKILGNRDRGRVQRVQGRMYDSERHVKDLINSEELEEKDAEGIEVPYYNFESLLEATDNFSDANKLGRGGYGPVYKGTFPGGQDIAVKRLSNVSSQGLKEFKNEVVLISKLQHRNLVRLRGYCIKGDEKILLYEYMPNKSLDFFIFDPTRSVLLDWQMRFDIILGVARGMLYLHQDSRLRVVHRDLKTSNILLDQEMQPKISDFGLAKIIAGKETEANTERVVGTYGYMSPEYALDGQFSAKSDIFSFGVMVLEIISGKKNTGFFQSKQVSSLLGYAWRLWTENKLMDLMEQSLSESCNANQFIRCAQVSLLCVQDEPGDRPTMSHVVIMLESDTASLPTPKQPTFFMNRALSNTASSSSKPETILKTDSSYWEGR